MIRFFFAPLRRSRTLRLFCFLLAAASLSSCALVIGGAVVGGAMVAVDRRTAGSQVDDETIELKANSRMNEAFGDRARVSVTSYNRMVLLTGEVPADADKTTAEQAVARIDNVLSVVNELTVGPLNTFSERSKDTFITTKVKASLIDAKDLFANSIKGRDAPRHGLPDGPRHGTRGESSHRDRARCQRCGQSGSGLRDPDRGGARQHRAEEPGQADAPASASAAKP